MKNFIHVLWLSVLLLLSSLTGLQAQCPPLPPPNNLNVTQITATTAHASWDPVSGANYYKVVLTNLFTGTVEQAFVQAPTSVNLTSLASNTKYKLDVYASGSVNCFSGLPSTKEFATGIIVTDNIVWFSGSTPNQANSHVSTVTNQFGGTTGYICLKKEADVSSVKVFHGIIASCPLNNITQAGCSDFLEFSLGADNQGFAHFPSFWVTNTNTPCQLLAYHLTGLSSLQMSTNTIYSDIGTITVKNSSGGVMAVISGLYPLGLNTQMISIDLYNGYRLYYSPDYTPGSSSCLNNNMAAPGQPVIINPAAQEKTEEAVAFEAASNQLSNTGIAPNPFTNAFHLRFDLDAPANCKAVVFDAYGRQVEDVIKDNNLAAGQYEYRVDAAHWPDGLYFLQFNNGKETKTIKLMKRE